MIYTAIFLENCPAQVNTIDSLQSFLEATVTDAEQINTYLGLSRENIHGTNEMQDGLHMANRSCDLGTNGD